VQAYLVHAEDILEGAIGETFLTLEQRHHRQEHGVELALGLGRRASVWLCSGRCPRPDEDFTFFIDGQSFGIDEVVFEDFQEVVIDLELELEDTVGHTALALQQLHGLCTDGSKVHHRPSTCASAASVCGSQKVMSMA
jgi:hypothetical protein